MAGNPLIAQGSLNRLRANVVWPAFASLNIAPSYLGRMGIHLALDGESTQYIETMAGAVTSPQPYMMITLTAHLLKTQQLASLYKAQMELSALIGDGTVYPDAAALGVYQVTNCAIQSVRELDFSGADAGWVVAFRGYYLVNASLWN